MTILDRYTALALLEECTGRDIWPVEHCRMQGVPDVWIEELQDAFESSFLRDRDTIYFQQRPVNQFHGVRDLDLAQRLGRDLGVDVDAVTAMAINSESSVRLIKEAVEEG